MYIFFSVCLVVLLLFCVINFYKKRCIIKKVRCKTECEKCKQLNELIKPSGFRYCLNEDIFTSELDAWQGEHGYSSLFDLSAPDFNCVFDCEPIYFDFRGRTWLLEFWKGQYGINIGSEIGLYCADTIIPPNRRKETQFHKINWAYMPGMAMELSLKGTPLFQTARRHWWLTGFRMGAFAWPKELSLEIALSFPWNAMRDAFLEGMHEAGYRHDEIKVREQYISFTFDVPRTDQPWPHHSLRRKFAMWRNHQLCRLYILATKPFTKTVDRLIYLWYFLPFVFRRLIRFGLRKS